MSYCAASYSLAHTIVAQLLSRLYNNVKIQGGSDMRSTALSKQPQMRFAMDGWNGRLGDARVGVVAALALGPPISTKEEEPWIDRQARPAQTAPWAITSLQKMAVLAACRAACVPMGSCNSDSGEFGGSSGTSTRFRVAAQSVSGMGMATTVVR